MLIDIKFPFPTEPENLMKIISVSEIKHHHVVKRHGKFKADNYVMNVRFSNYL